MKRVNSLRVLVLGLALAIGAMAGGGMAPAAALAHAGHSGKMLTFLDTRLALKQMLPDGAKVVRRKEALSDATAGWVKDTLGVTVDADLYTFYLAKAADGTAAGLAMEVDFPYGHGMVDLALGIDPQGHVTQAAVLGIHEKFLPELMRGPGKGVLPELAGKDVKGLAELAALPDDGTSARQEVLGHLRDMAAVLAGLAHQM